MRRLPDRPNLDNLKKQAKDLLALHRRGDPAALARFREALPVAGAKSDQQIAALDLRLHDAEALSESEGFIAACAMGDETAARQMLSARPNLVRTLSDVQLRLLPELAAEGCSEAVKLMVGLGWPIAVRGGDWEASALNHAVFRGDADLARFLLEHHASWKEPHAFGDNVCGTLSWASLNEPACGGDWLGCARALVAHGMPAGSPDSDQAGGVIINGETKWFSDDVTDFLLDPSSASTARFDRE